jgi:hypothetical protein
MRNGFAQNKRDEDKEEVEKNSGVDEALKLESA